MPWTVSTLIGLILLLVWSAIWRTIFNSSKEYCSWKRRWGFNGALMFWNQTYLAATAAEAAYTVCQWRSQKCELRALPPVLSPFVPSPSFSYLSPSLPLSFSFPCLPLTSRRLEVGFLYWLLATPLLDAGFTIENSPIEAL